MYYGEWKEVDSHLKIEGRGALICTDKVFLGYTIDGMWADRSPQIFIDKKKCVCRVFIIQKARPNGKCFEHGRTFGNKGLLSSGIYLNGKLIYEHEFPIQKTGLLSLSGKIQYKDDVFKVGVREGRNDEDGLVIVTSGDSFQIGYFKDGQKAPGSYISGDPNNYNHLFIRVGKHIMVKR